MMLALERDRSNLEYNGDQYVGVNYNLYSMKCATTRKSQFEIFKECEKTAANVNFYRQFRLDLSHRRPRGSMRNNCNRPEGNSAPGDLVCGPTITFRVTCRLLFGS